jgi:hypothetical protein
MDTNDEGQMPKILRVDFKILGGFQIPCKASKLRDIVDPFVELVLYSTKSPLEPSIHLKTKIIDDNGFNPEWNESVSFEVFEQEINMIVLRVKDNDNTLLCWNALCLDVLHKKGTFAVEMRAPNFRVLPGTALLCHINIELQS